MPTPSASVTFWAVPSGATTVVAIGNVVLPDTSGGWVVSTSANRTAIGRRSEGVAVTSYGGSGLGSVEIWQNGTIDATVSGLAAGSASWVRCSTAGIIERFTPTPGGTSDIIGKAAADGRVTLAFGIWTDDLALASGSGSSFTAGGDLSGTSTVQSVDKVKATAITTSGGALATGAVMRATGVATADWGAVNLASANAVTGLLPLANITPSGTNTWVLTTTGGVPVWAAPSGSGFTAGGDLSGTSSSQTVIRVNGATVPAAGALTTGNAAYVSGASALTYSALNLAGGSGWVTGTLPLGNGGTGLTAVPGSSGNPIINSSSVYGAATNWTMGTGLTGSTSSFVTVLSYLQTPILRASSSFVGIDGSTSALFVGSDSSYANGYTDLRLNTNTTSGNIYLMLGSQGCITISNSVTTLRARAVSGALSLTTTANFSLAVGGDAAATSTFQWQSATITYSNANITLSAAQAASPYLKIVGTGPGSGTLDLVAPDAIGTEYTIKGGWTGSWAPLLKKSGGVGVAVTNNITHKYIHNGTDYESES